MNSPLHTPHNYKRCGSPLPLRGPVRQSIAYDGEPARVNWISKGQAVLTFQPHIRVRPPLGSCAGRNHALTCYGWSIYLPATCMSPTLETEGRSVGRTKEPVPKGELYALPAAGVDRRPKKRPPSPHRYYPDLSAAPARSWPDLRGFPRRKTHQQFSRDAGRARRAGLDHL